MALPPPPPAPIALPPAIICRVERLAQADFRLPNEAPGNSLEKATQKFGEAIQALPSGDREAIQAIHAGVDEWAKGKQDPDRLGQFLVRVMLWADQKLKDLDTSPAGDCQALEKVFTSGFQMVEVYSAVGQR